MCNICNYESDRSNNYKKHLQSKKHNKLTNNIPKFNNSNVMNIHTSNTHRYPKIPAINLDNPINIIERKHNYNNKEDSGNNINNNIICEYCSKSFNTSKHITNHLIKSCIKIPDKIKNRLIIKHNNNPRTKVKVPLVISTNNNSKVYNINNNISGNTINTSNNNIDNSITNNDVINNSITNNDISLNTFSNQSFDHIPDDKLNEIAKGDTSLMYLLCREMSKLPENNNTFINTRKDLAFYFDDDKTIKIDRIKQYTYKFCTKYMERMKQYILDNPDKFTQITKNVFKDTYDIYFCIINKHNFDNMDEIEAEHEEMVKQFVDDVKINLINSNKVSRKYLDSIEKDFYKLT